MFTLLISILSLVSLTWAQIRAFVTISEGNRKLKSSDNCRFLIFNLPAIVTCPFKTVLCSKSCYARKAEKAYPNCIAARNRNYEFTKLNDLFVRFMVLAIHSICSKPKYTKAKKIVFRIHESGDFYSVQYFKNWIEIARRCQDIEKLTFMAYTKSVQYYDILRKSGIRESSNFTIRYSIWDDTEPSDIALAESYNLPIYTAYPKGHFPVNYRKCNCADCGKCQMCFKSDFDKKRIACEIH